MVNSIQIIVNTKQEQTMRQGVRKKRENLCLLASTFASLPVFDLASAPVCVCVTSSLRRSTFASSVNKPLFLINYENASLYF